MAVDQETAVNVRVGPDPDHNVLDAAVMIRYLVILEGYAEGAGGLLQVVRHLVHRVRLVHRVVYLYG